VISRRLVLLFVLFLSFAGTLCLVQAWRTPVWKDNEKAFALENEDIPEGIVARSAEHDAFNRHWFDEMNALRTARYPLYDLGTGLIALAFCIAGVMLTPWGTTSIGSMRTPSRKWHILLLAALVWTGFWVGTVVDAVRMVHRFEVPPWADTLAIPIFAAKQVFVMLGPPFLLIVWIGGLWGARLPASLWLWKKERPWASWTSVAVTTVPLVGSVFLLGASVISGPAMNVPVMLGLTYLVLTLRAGALSRFT
jgi:hypothetical protein